MKKTIIFFFLIACSVAAFAQSQHDYEYMEIRPLGNSWSFRTAPNAPFQRVGFLGKNLKTQLKDDPLALSHVRKSYRSLIGLYGSIPLTSLGMTVGLFGVLEGNRPMIISGSTLLAGGLTSMMFFADRQFRQLQKAVDAYNQGKSTTLTLPKMQPVFDAQNTGIALVWTF